MTSIREPGLRQVGFSHARIGDMVMWYALSAVVVFALPSVVWYRVRPWQLPPSDEIQAWYWMVAFLVAAFGVTLVRTTSKRPSLLIATAVVIAPWVLGYLALMFRQDVGHSRGIALASAVIGTGLLLTPAVVSPIVVRGLTGVGAVLVAMAGVMVGSKSAAADTASVTDAAARTVINTAVVPLAVTYEKGLVADTLVPGGALARLGRGALLVTGTGTWYDIGWDSTGEHLSTRLLDIPAPMRRDELPTTNPRVPFLRVTGLAISTTPEGITAYVAHEVWRREEGCVAVQVSSLRLRTPGLAAADSAWRPIYVTQPCIQAVEGFDRFETGGRILARADGSLLLTVGDYGQNRVASTAMAQQPGGDYGKTLLIDAEGRRKLHTMGHRNPGGLTADRNGNLWVAEHGPRGGDEINLLQAGANYGWPVVTYGTDYDSYRWRFSPPASSAPFREPSYVMVPSVGISNLIAVEGKRFETWAGDLLAGSLVGEQLLRFRLTGTRVAYVEPISVDRRIRDLVELEDGRIVIWADGGDLVWLAPDTNVMLGALAYETCFRCHGRVTGAGTRYAPNLAGLFGRRVAADSGFLYSDAFKRVRGIWTEERLDEFLRSPSEFAPGNAMDFPGIADSSQRRLLVEYIRTGPGRPQ